MAGARGKMWNWGRRLQVGCNWLRSIWVVEASPTVNLGGLTEFQGDALGNPLLLILHSFPAAVPFDPCRGPEKREGRICSLC